MVVVVELVVVLVAGLAVVEVEEEVEEEVEVEVGAVVVSEYFPNAWLIALRRGKSPEHFPRKSSVSILHTIAPAMLYCKACSILAAIEFGSS